MDFVSIKETKHADQLTSTAKEDENQKGTVPNQ